MSEESLDIRLSVQVAPEFASRVDLGQLRKAVAAALREKPPADINHPTVPIELSVVITDDEEMRRLNRTYRKMDASTDVLAFSMGETLEGTLYLGDIVLSYPRAVEQAEEYGHTPQAELNLLTVHGVLHLLGYDHKTKEGEREMWSLQEHALAQLSPL